MAKTKGTQSNRSRPASPPRKNRGDGADRKDSARQGLPKTPTGIAGLDEVTVGGLPTGRPTLVCGGAGCGKTLLGMEFLVRGATEFGEPGVFVAFEENARDLTTNVRALGFDLDDLVARKQLVIDFVRIERSEIEETGDFDLEGLFVRMAHAIATIGAKRIVLDTLEALFSGFSNEAILRAELRRLFAWLKEKGITALITAEKGEGQLTRHGLEEYVSDCVIVLDHRVIDQVSTRRIRIVKYRGSVHGTNEYPFLIDEDGISVVPITSLGLRHAASTERISSGIASLDEMLGGKGFYRGSTVMVSGTAGTGKTSIGSQFVDAACRRGEKCLYFAFEESPGQILRNMRSIGLELEPWVKKGLLQFHAVRATVQGLEMHLAMLHKLTRDVEPRVVVFDPFDSLGQVGTAQEATSMLTRLIDFFKTESITAMLLNLMPGGGPLESSGMNVSSLVDTWLLLRDEEHGGVRQRSISVLKSRGMAHSNLVQGLVLDDRGVHVIPPAQGTGRSATEVAVPSKGNRRPPMKTVASRSPRPSIASRS